MNALGVDIGGTSVKAVVLDGDRELARAQSHPYERPDARALIQAVGEVAAALRPAAGPRPYSSRGLCVPGVLDPSGHHVVRSLNAPGLEGVNLVSLLAPFGDSRQAPALVSDAHAAALDIHATHPVPGRLLALSLGTGVGACVLDGGRFLRISRPDAGPSSGHLGQIDVSLSDAAPLGPDGGKGGLEAYIGLPALKWRWGADWPRPLAADPASEPLRALVRALRIAHALYRPDAIYLLGGVALALVPLGPALQAAVNDRLTALAIPSWRLGFAQDAFHAARGAARLAAVGVNAPA